jgi:allophanate hydrolase
LRVSTPQRQNKIVKPLGIGKIELEGGAKVPGFLCESSGTKDAVDITASGGWRAYLQACHSL